MQKKVDLLQFLKVSEASFNEWGRIITNQEKNKDFKRVYKKGAIL